MAVELSSIQQPVDLTTCDREPIHIPGSIQPHGVLLVLEEPEFTVIQASANTDEYLGLPVQEVLGRTPASLIAGEEGERLTQGLRRAAVEQTSIRLQNISFPTRGTEFYAVAHGFGGRLILELELATEAQGVAFQSLYPLVHSFFTKLKMVSSIGDLAQIAAEEVRRITGFDRVLVYKFDPSWHGHVIAEAQDGDCPSYLDLWFPASDIPQQARKLYERNRLRLIADVDYTPVPIVPELDPRTGLPLDLSLAGLRSISPVHLEYLRNMQVASSMSVSMIVEDGRLWGLISCHHRTPRIVPFEARTACEFLAQALAVQLEANEQRTEYEQRIRLKSIVTRLLATMSAEEEFIRGLTKSSGELLEFARAGGAAVLYEDQCTRLGDCPAEEDIWNLVNWLVEQGREEIYFSDCLPAAIPNGEAYRERASGVLAISISKLYRSYVLWFRPEAVQTVQWAGDPRKPVEQEENGSARLHPRKSFDTWKETVKGRSIAWTPVEIDAAGELRNAIIGIVLRKAEELAGLTAELQRSNKELEAFSYSVSHDLRAPFRHIVGYAELLKQSKTAQLAPGDVRYLDVIINSAHFAGTLVDNLLGFSRVGRVMLNVRPIDMGLLVAEVVREADMLEKHRKIRWEIGSLPKAEGDVMMLKMVWQNLIQNAVKYTRSREEAVIEIQGAAEEKEIIYSICDNGVGFDQAYSDKLFGVFQRLHRQEDYEGTGIGLANVRRIIARHGGRTWAEGEVDRGACFYFSLPGETRADARRA